VKLPPEREPACPPCAGCTRIRVCLSSVHALLARLAAAAHTAPAADADALHSSSCIHVVSAADADAAQRREAGADGADPGPLRCARRALEGPHHCQAGPAGACVRVWFGWVWGCACARACVQVKVRPVGCAQEGPWLCALPARILFACAHLLPYLLCLDACAHAPCEPGRACALSTSCMQSQGVVRRGPIWAAPG